MFFIIYNHQFQMNADYSKSSSKKEDTNALHFKTDINRTLSLKRSVVEIDR